MSVWPIVFREAPCFSTGSESELEKDGAGRMPKKSITIDAWSAKEDKPLRYWELNEKIHDTADSGYRNIVVKNVCGQRFICVVWSIRT